MVTPHELKGGVWCSPLHHAATLGNLFILKDFVSQNADVNMPDNVGNTPLHLAVLSKYPKAVAYLLFVDANVNVANVNGSTPLHLAAMDGFSKAVSILLEAGAILNVYDNNRWTPLHVATNRCHMDVARILVGNGADINVINNSGATPLMVANDASLPTVKFLLENGADLSVRDSQGNTALLIAVIDGFSDLVGLLLEAGANVNAANETGDTALHLAASRGFKSIVTKLLAADSSGILTLNQFYHTPLSLAILGQHCEVSSSLLSAESELVSSKERGLTPLHLAAQKYGISLVFEQIIDEFSHFIDSRSASGCTPLHLASELGLFNNVKKLVIAGSIVNVEDRLGRTPEVLAINNDHKEVGAFLSILKANHDIVDYLINSNAEPGVQISNKQMDLEPSASVEYINIVECLFGCQNLLNNPCNSHGRTYLHKTVQEGDVVMLKCLLELDVDVNISDNVGYTPLFLALALYDNALTFECIQCLLHAKADINILDSHGNTLLHVATKFHPLNIVQCLNKAGVNLNATNKNGETALHIAAEEGKLDVFAYLVGAGADVSTEDTLLSWTPLHLAAATGQMNVVKWILENTRMDKDLVDKEGLTPLHVAISKRNVEMVQCLIECGVDVNKRDKNGWTALLMASRDNNPQIVNLLLKAKARIDITNMYGKTPLHIAAAKGSNEMFDFFLRWSNVCVTDVQQSDIQDTNAFCKTNDEANSSLQDASLVVSCSDELKLVLNMVDNQGDTPLHIATKFGYVSLVEKLILCGANVQKINSNGNSSLHIAAIYANLQNDKIPCPFSKIVDVLLNAKADINMLNNKRETPLHIAICQRRSTMVKKLICAGAKLNLFNGAGYTPLNLATMQLCKGSSSVTRYIELQKSMKIIKMLLQFGADINGMNQRKETPLHVAIIKRQKKIVDELILAGANVDLLDGQGRSALHLSVCHSKQSSEYGNSIPSISGSLNIVDLLLKAKADINIFNKAGQTPLFFALSKRQIHIAQRLILAGADLNKQEHVNGDTPLHLAVTLDHNCDNKQSTCQSYVKMLLKHNSKVLVLNNAQQTPIHVATRLNSLESVRLLMTADRCTLLSRDINVMTPLHISASQGNLECVQLLISDDLVHLNAFIMISASMASVDVKGRSPLHLSVLNAHHNVVKYLINKHANVNVVDKLGLTPLHYAAWLNNTDIILTLKNHVINIDSNDKLNNSALDLTVYNNCHEAKNILLKLGAQKAHVSGVVLSKSLHEKYQKWFK